MSKEFIWTDELVAEFTSWSLGQAPAFQGRYADIEQFKKSKEVKPIPEKKLHFTNSFFMKVGDGFKGEIITEIINGGTGVYFKTKPKEHTPDYEILERFPYYQRANDGEMGAIKKVRRLSDKTTWEVGDKNKYGIVKSFEIVKNKMWVYHTTAYYVELKDLVKVPNSTPLFTEDQYKEIWNMIFSQTRYPEWHEKHPKNNL